MSFEMLLKVNENMYINLVEHIKNSVFKDQIEADKYETREVVENATIFMNAIFTNNILSINQYHTNTKLVYDLGVQYGSHEHIPEDVDVPVYYERNRYYRELYGKYGINIYTARQSRDFELLYSPFGYVEEKITSIFREQHFSCLIYFMKVMYTEAYAGNVNYRNFVNFIINFMALERTLDKFRDPTGMNIELMDAYAIKNLLYSSGITFLDQLTPSYQKLVVRNLNEILRYKGTTKVFTSIFKIFGFENVEAFKYYILKDYERNPHVDYTKPELKFLRLPFEEQNPEKFISQISYEEQQQLVYEYSSVIAGDENWQCTQDEILAKEFNIINSKYFDISSAVDVMSFTIQIVYFFNTLMYVRQNRQSDEKIMFYASEISSSSISLLDGFLGLSVLTMAIIGFRDNIPKSPEEIDRIYGFNHQINRSELSSTFLNDPELSIIPFMTVDSLQSEITILEMNNLLNQNTILRNKIKDKLSRTQNLKEYQDLLSDYNKLFISSIMVNKFSNYDNYLEYLKDKSPDLANYITSAIDNDEGNLLSIRQAFAIISTNIENFVNNTSIRPSVLNISYILEFVKKMINAFKAYTIHLKNLSVFYKIEDPLYSLKILDKTESEASFNIKDQVIDTRSIISIFQELKIDDLLGLVSSDYSILSELKNTDLLDISDKLINNSNLNVSTPLNIEDSINKTKVLIVNELPLVSEIVQIT